MIELLSKPQVN